MRCDLPPRFMTMLLCTLDVACATQVTEMQSNLMAGGKPRRVDFTIQLVNYGDDVVTGGSTGGNNNSGGDHSIWDLIGEVGDFFDNLNSSNVA